MKQATVGGLHTGVTVEVPETIQEAEQAFTCPAYRCAMAGKACAGRHLSGQAGHPGMGTCKGCPAGASRAQLLDVEAPTRAEVIRNLTQVGNRFLPPTVKKPATEVEDMTQAEKSKKIKDLLVKEGKLGSTAIAAATGFTATMVRDTLQLLRAGGEVTVSGRARGALWSLAEQSDQAAVASERHLEIDLLAGPPEPTYLMLGAGATPGVARPGLEADAIVVDDPLHQRADYLPAENPQSDQEDAAAAAAEPDGFWLDPLCAALGVSLGNISSAELVALAVRKFEELKTQTADAKEDARETGRQLGRGQIAMEVLQEIEELLGGEELNFDGEGLVEALRARLGEEHPYLLTWPGGEVIETGRSAEDAVARAIGEDGPMWGSPYAKNVSDVEARPVTKEEAMRWWERARNAQADLSTVATALLGEGFTGKRVFPGGQDEPTVEDVARFAKTCRETLAGICQIFNQPTPATPEDVEAIGGLVRTSIPSDYVKDLVASAGKARPWLVSDPKDPDSGAVCIDAKTADDAYDVATITGGPFDGRHPIEVQPLDAETWLRLCERAQEAEKALTDLETDLAEVAAEAGLEGLEAQSGEDAADHVIRIGEALAARAMVGGADPSPTTPAPLSAHAAAGVALLLDLAQMALRGITPAPLMEEKPCPPGPGQIALWCCAARDMVADLWHVPAGEGLGGLRLIVDWAFGDYLNLQGGLDPDKRYPDARDQADLWARRALQFNEKQNEIERLRGACNSLEVNLSHEIALRQSLAEANSHLFLALASTAKAAELATRRPRFLTLPGGKA